MHLDVTSGDWAAAVELTLAAYGRLDVLFNNAGIFSGGQLQRYRREQWREMLDVNLTGAFLGMKAAADALIATGGSIIKRPRSGACAGHPGHTGTSPRSGACGADQVCGDGARTARRPRELAAPRPHLPPATDQMPEDLIPIPLGRQVSPPRSRRWSSSWPATSRRSPPGRSS